jgi:hypothetical protein
MTILRSGLLASIESPSCGATSGLPVKPRGYAQPVNGNFPPAEVRRPIGHIANRAGSAHPQKG